MSELTNYAILGLGRVGKVIFSALISAKPDAQILILTRSGSSKSPTIPAGATNVQVEAVDYDSLDAFAAVLSKHKTQILINTAPIHDPTSGAMHARIAEGAKKAGVQLFVPSEFGSITEGLDTNSKESEGPLVEKGKLQGKLKEIGLPFVLIQNSLFLEFLPWLAATHTGKFNIIGKGETPISTTSFVDAAGFLVHILTTQPLSSLLNSSFRIEGDRGTLTQFAQRLGYPITHVTRIPDDLEFNKEHGLPTDESKPNFQTILQGVFEKGMGSVGWNYETGKDEPELVGRDNGYWEGYKWRKVEDVHGVNLKGV